MKSGYGRLYVLEKRMSSSSKSKSSSKVLSPPSSATMGMIIGTKPAVKADVNANTTNVNISRHDQIGKFSKFKHQNDTG